MAFVPGFEHDCFISYAHVDDLPLVPDEPGWVERFHYALQVRVQQLLGAEVVFWRDARLQGNDDFSEALLEKFGKVATLISIHSPRYLQSAWCCREVEHFLKTGGERLLGERSRIFKVMKYPVPLQEQHAFLQKLLGYEFFEVDPASGRAREYGQDSGALKDLRYWTRLDDLANDLADVLQRLRSDGTQTATGNGGRRIYIASTSSDLRDAVDSLRRECQEHDLDILPDRPLPAIAPELLQVVMEHLRQADVAVYPIGAYRGLVPEQSERSIVELQLDAGTASDLPRLIWIPPGLQAADSSQQALLSQLRREGLSGFEVLECPLDTLHTRIQNTLAEAAPETHVIAGDGLLYLVYDDADFDAIDPMEAALFDAGWDVVTALSEGSDEERRHDHLENLRRCEAVVIFHGEAPQSWFRDTLRQLEDCLRECPEPPPSAVVFLPPEHRDKQRFRSRQHICLNSTAGFSIKDLQLFLQQQLRALA